MLGSILIIEDHPVHAKLFGDMLRVHGHTSMVAATGSTGLILAQEMEPAVIVVDIKLPDVDGREVIARLRADPATRHIPVLAISAMADNGLQDDCTLAGADRFVSKPISLHAFTGAVTQLRDAPRWR
ncbi:two-component system, cell cycle response regulator DivK [Sphingomonas gellani]|uniref:Two-component system, cell cycle response regulator DivK n=1 Tax=Sphingomonas gellani TaxID=1166340 RepID=A0A1H8I045_9SPHN|nr:response regulator [Sphingomonas gellani]SEN61526.1 two-component system, cell cycle response regulator DivK [Sphingomonas gellani]